MGTAIDLVKERHCDLHGHDLALGNICVDELAILGVGILPLRTQAVTRAQVHPATNRNAASHPNNRIRLYRESKPSTLEGATRGRGCARQQLGRLALTIRTPRPSCRT